MTNIILTLNPKYSTEQATTKKINYILAKNRPEDWFQQELISM